jgi:hypothetical protein
VALPERKRQKMHVYDQFKLRHLRNLEIDVSALYVIAARHRRRSLA